MENSKVSHERILILLLGFLTAFGPLSIDTYLPALPSLAENLNTDFKMAQLSLSSYFIGLAIGQIFYGPFTDRFGRKIPLYFGIAIYCLSSLICAMASSIEILIFFRFVQALGACAGVVVTRAIVRDVYGGQGAARIFSILILIMGVAPIVAPLIGGYIAVHFGWRYIFVFLALMSFICVTGIYFFMEETHHGNRQKTKVIKNYLTILGHRDFLRNTYAGGIAQSGMFAYIAGSSYVFIEVFSVKPENFGYIFGTNALGLILCSQINGKLLKKYSPEKILNIIFPILFLLGAILIITSFTVSSLFFVWLPIFIFMSFLGMTFPNTTALALEKEGERAGSASALLGTIQYGLAAVVTAVMSLFSNAGSMPMLFVMGACAILSSLIFYFTKK